MLPDTLTGRRVNFECLLHAIFGKLVLVVLRQKRQAVLRVDVIGPAVAQIASGTEVHAVRGMTQIVQAIAAFDVAPADFELSLAGNSIVLTAPIGERLAVRADHGNLGSAIRAADELVFLRRHQRIAAVDFLRIAADRSGAKEQAGRSNLRDRVIVGEHEARINVEFLVFLVMGEEAARIARVGPLQIVERAVVEVLIGSTGIRHEVAATSFACSFLEPVVGLSTLAVAKKVIVEREETVEIGRSRADQADVGRCQRALGEIARRLEHGLRVAITEIGRDVALVVRRVGAHDERAVVGRTVPDVFLGLREAIGAAINVDLRLCAPPFRAVVVLVDRVRAVDFDALEVLAHDEVDDACQRVRAVHGRGAAGQDFHVIDESGGDVVEVGRGVFHVARHQAGAVYKNQRAHRTQASQVRVRSSGRTIRHGAALVGKGFRQIVEEGRDVGRSLEFQLLLTDGRDRAGGVHTRLWNAGAGNHHGFDVAAALLRGRGNGYADGCSGSCSKEQGGAQIACILVGSKHVKPPWFCR